MSAGNGKLDESVSVGDFAELRRDTQERIRTLEDSLEDSLGGLAHAIASVDVKVSAISDQAAEHRQDRARHSAAVEGEVRRLNTEVVARGERLSVIGLDVGALKRELNGLRASVENRLEELSVLLKQNNEMVAGGFGAISHRFAELAVRRAEDNEYRDLQAEVQTARNTATDQLLGLILARLDALAGTSA